MDNRQRTPEGRPYYQCEYNKALEIFLDEQQLTDTELTEGNIKSIKGTLAYKRIELRLEVEQLKQTLANTIFGVVNG